MYHKLHLQFSFFCSFITSSIVLFLSLLCLLYAKDSLKKGDFASFQQGLNAILLPLQEQDIISHQWINQIQAQGQRKLFLYDNGEAFYYQKYHLDQEAEELQKEVIAAAKKKQQMDIFSYQTKQVITHTEFTFQSQTGTDYMVSAGVIPKERSYLSFLYLYSLEKQKTELKRLQFVFCLADLAAVLFLFLFSWFFTAHILRPLEQSRKKQMDFIASASHELRAPLAVMRSALEVMEKTDSDTEKQRSIQYMEEESGRMQNLIQELLLLANADSKNLPLHREICDAEELLLSVYEKYEAIARNKQRRMAIVLPQEGEFFSFCDREKLTQVLFILVDNAISYTPAGGKITLSLERRKHALCFLVSDTGRGISAEEKKRIFERFYRTEQSRSDKSHFGLGLCIAAEIVKEHQGDIRVEDVPEGGSCFIVLLPAELGITS